jgi:serine/threonine protein kinase/formylglycine-generating enzyme required for sulfatase activity
MLPDCPPGSLRSFQFLMSKPERDPSRLARAIRLGLEFRSSGRTDVEAFLSEHDALRELLEPLVDGDWESEPPDAGAGTGGARPGQAAPGRTFGGYQLECEIGRGGMGTVYLASQTALDRQLAVKVLTAPSLLVSERSLARFEREAKLLASLEHPGLVRVFDAGVQDGTPYFAMELVRGASLAELLAAVRRAGSLGSGTGTLRAALLGAAASRPASMLLGASDGTAAWRLPDDHVAAMVTLVAEIAEALACAHDSGVVHRDVKPSNILVREDGRALLVDFGVAQQEGAATLTATGDIAGTPTYMAPEQVRGGEADARTDVWALGVTLYEALTLQLPFDGGTSAQIVQRLLHEEPADPRRHNPAVGTDLAAVTGMALTKDPAQRYQAASEFAAELRAVLAGQPVRARLAGPIERLGRWLRREPWRGTAVVLAAAAAVTVVVVDQVHAADLRAESTRRSATLTEVNRLTIGVRLDRAVEAARAFDWPGVDALPAIAAWQRQHHDPLAAELPGMEALLERLRGEALPYGEAEALADRSSHPEAVALQRLEAELAAIGDVPVDQRSADVATRHERLLAEQPKLRARVEARRSWRFADVQRQFLHDEVILVLTRLRDFLAPNGLAARVSRAAAWAVESQRRCIDEAAATWQKVAADVAADPRFAGLRLVPQRDLLPLGKDPRSGLWEFVHLASGRPGAELPKRRDDGSLAPEDGFGIVFVLLPGGAFAFGAQAEDANAPNHDPAAERLEGPVQTVTLAPFFLGKFELTRSQWHKITNGEQVGTPTMVKPPGLAPVDAVAQRRAAAALAAVRLELPTEAQWEYACRAGTGTPWHFGARASAAKYANFAGTSAPPGQPHDADVEDDGHRDLVAPGSFAPNAFGLHDMHGNVAEFTCDRIGHYVKLQQDGRGSGRAQFDELRIVGRGGSYQSRLVASRASMRGMVRLTGPMPGVGLRAARRMEP